ncbi:ATP-grasp fold amidoligase family protein [Microvirga pudoricolor]|uniref:ATP-grasp fold amidoligase family protein n=1 Tax=Microvirga pudoricolor TaxID=2778729 RepID=UPI002277227C|nr:ATP-grasp fold amidoligase family protein [Microvirga pudoricolor]MBM6594078.1 hypothetical protein [Microvirga pudoricolor]
MLGLSSVKQAIWATLPDAWAVGIQYRRAHGRFPDLRRPATFTEKVQFRKLYDRDARMPLFADKAKVKDLISAMVGSRYVIPTLWTGRDVETVDFDALARPFVIKPTHSCGQAIFVRETDVMDWNEVRARCHAWMDSLYGSRTREWLYGHIEPAVMIESMIGDGQTPPADYKFFVFHGRTQLIQVDIQRFGDGQERAIYDAEWRRLAVQSTYPDTRHEVHRPELLAEMKRVAEAIGSPFDFVRVDLYVVAGRVYFGETTFYPASGYARYRPDGFDAELGRHWHIDAKAPPAREQTAFSFG